MNIKKYFSIGLLFFSLVTGLSQVFPEDISDIIDTLFSQEQRQAEYNQIYGSLLSVFLGLEQQGLPLESLLDKLKEGLAKKVSPEKLLAGIENEALRIKQAYALLNRVQFSFENENEKNQLYNRISLYLLGGLSEDLVESMLRGAKNKKPALKVFQSLGTTILKLKTITGLNEGEFMSLSQVMLNSALSYTNYSMITALFVKAKFRKVSDQEMFSLVIYILKRGGGILQIEEELSRRTKR
ncbi:MAG: hypothetical protein JW822_06485 [Spirochaetales bacterium]|nr:hypothetical protein [Spirochaetales bacterium]